MSTALNMLLHTLLIGSMIGFLFAIATVTFSTGNGIERLIRCSALFSGAMVVLGAQAAGVSFADFAVESLSGSKLFSGAGLTATVVPGGAGVAMGWYLTRSLRRSENIAIRVLAFVGMLAITQFAQIYVVATSTKGVELGSTAVPNIAFVVGISIYVMLKYDPDSKVDAPTSWRDKLRVGRSLAEELKSGASGAPSKAAPTAAPAFFTPDPRK
jgi:hypothetical protein